jgi:hypothetical protein
LDLVIYPSDIAGAPPIGCLTLAAVVNTTTAVMAVANTKEKVIMCLLGKSPDPQIHGWHPGIAWHVMTITNCRFSNV